MYNERSIFWDITPCSPLKDNRRFGGAGSKQSSVMLPASPWFLVWLILRAWRFRWHVPPKRQLSFNGQHGVISYKSEHLVTTSNHARYMTKWRTRGSLSKRCCFFLALGRCLTSVSPGHRQSWGLSRFSSARPGECLNSWLALKSTTAVSFYILSNVLFLRRPSCIAWATYSPLNKP
jgi:hypothetical protein